MRNVINIFTSGSVLDYYRCIYHMWNIVPEFTKCIAFAACCDNLGIWFIYFLSHM